MTDAVASGGTTNPTQADSTQTTGEAPASASLLTNGAPAAAEVKADDAAGVKAETKDGEGKPDDAASKEDVKYEFQAPEGVELDGDATAEFTALAKELKLPAAEAQRVVDIAVKMQQKQAERNAETVKGWAESSKTDKEFGGDNLQANLAIAQKAIDTFGSPELKTLLNSSGLGNHPELVRFAFKAGKAISEDGFVKGGARSAVTAGVPLAKRLYPDMN